MAPTVAFRREAMGYVKRSIVKSSIPASPLKKTVTAALEVAAEVAEGPEVHHEKPAVVVVSMSTPKAKKHRIPVVDVDLCPGAPKKPRRCSGTPNFIQKLSFSPNYLF